MMNIKEDYLQWYTSFFDKKSQESGRSLSSAPFIANNKENIQLADELHKPIIKKFKKRVFFI